MVILHEDLRAFLCPEVNGWGIPNQIVSQATTWESSTMKSSPSQIYRPRKVIDPRNSNINWRCSMRLKVTFWQNKRNYLHCLQATIHDLKI